MIADNVSNIVLIVTVIISLYTLVSSTRQSTFKNLETIVDRLQEEIADLKKDLAVREATIISREAAIEKLVVDLKNAINTKNKFVEVLEREFEEAKGLKLYIKSLVETLKGKGIEFPSAPAGLLDTEPKIVIVNGDEKKEV